MYLNGCGFIVPVLAVPGSCPACSLCCRGVVPLGPELVLLMQPLKLEEKCQLLHADPEAMWKGSSSSCCPGTRENSPQQSGPLLLMHTSGKPHKYEYRLNQANRECQALHGPPSTFSSPFFLCREQSLESILISPWRIRAGVLSAVSLWGTLATSTLLVKGSLAALLYFAVHFFFSPLSASSQLFIFWSRRRSYFLWQQLFCAGSAQATLAWYLIITKKGREKDGSPGCILVNLKYGEFFGWELFCNSSWGAVVGRGATAAFRAGSWYGAGNHTGVHVS